MATSEQTYVFLFISLWNTQDVVIQKDGHVFHWDLPEVMVFDFRTVIRCLLAVF